MKFGCGMLTLATFLQVASADVNDADRYTLPSKGYIETCQREALLLHPGVIEKQRTLHQHGDFWVEPECTS
jgi:hypothetical protein